jgi:hypothetical protein
LEVALLKCIGECRGESENAVHHRHASLWCIEILPRLATPAGFEPGSRIIVNNQIPDQATVDPRASL